MAVGKTVSILLAILVCVIIVTCILLLIFLIPRSGEYLIVETSTGPVRGVRILSDVSNFYAFFSIPYAEPPVGDLRFSAPKPIGYNANIHDGTTEGPRCIQNGNSYMSEDCLTLTVYTTDTEGSGKPVLVWLHGGALEAGSASMSNFGPHYFMQQDVVVVTVQFRLGMLGFLNLKLADAPGNMALADAIEAVKWVKQNIHFFGGNFSEIILGGTSSGAIMTHAILLSPLSEGLLHGAIVQSGTVLSYRFYHSSTEESIEKTKQELQMNGSSNEMILSRLKTLPPSELLQITTNIRNRYPRVYALYYPYVITQEDLLGILPDNPLKIMQSNAYKNIPILIGLTSNEGIRLATSMHLLEFVDENFNIVVPTDLYSIDDASLNKNRTASVIKDFYFGNSSLNEHTFQQYANLCTDSWYGHITDYVVRLKAYQNYNSNIYYYVFSVDGAFNVKINDGITYPGANHGDDAGYLWQREDLSSVVPDDYSLLSRQKMVKMWSNFIKTGDPTPELDDLLSVKWEPMKYPNANYLHINETIAMEDNLFRDRLLFWQRLYQLQEL